MANLLDADRLDLWAEVMTDFSKTNISTPLTKTDLRNLINYLDEELAATEVSVLAGIPAGDGKDWLVANNDLGRELMARVQRKRRETI